MVKLFDHVILSTLLLVVLICGAWEVSGYDDSENSVSYRDDDWQYLIPCEGISNDTFMLKWKPKIIKTDEKIVAVVHLKMVDSFRYGNVCATVWLDDLPDPIYADCRVEQCDSLMRVVKKYLPQLECPIKKGWSLKQTYPFKIPVTIPLPEGDYTVKLHVRNENNNVIACFSGKIIIKEE